jgi:hypothetical protein
MPIQHRHIRHASHDHSVGRRQIPERSTMPTARAHQPRLSTGRLAASLVVLLALLTTVVPGSVQASHDISPVVAYAEAALHHEEVRSLYLAYFGREPDARGAAYWQNRRRSGVSVAAISAYFAASAEFQGRYGELDDAGFVALVYANVLARTPDPGGYDYWRQQLSRGLSRGTLMAHFARAPEFIHRHQLREVIHSTTPTTTPAPGGTSGGEAAPTPAPPSAPTTTQPTSTSSTAPPQTSTTTSAPPPTTAPPSTIAPPPTTVAAPTSGGFVETFDNSQGLSRFRTGVFHRDLDAQTHGSTSGSWVADHNPNNADCGNPHEHQHTVTKANRAAAIFVCRDHMMTTMGDVDGYSVVWFSPNQTFNGQRTVSWDVNSTYLGGRQWWEVAIIPAGTPRVTCIDWLPCDTAHYHRDAVVVGTRDGSVRVWSTNTERTPDWRTFCRSNEYSLETRDACTSKATRRPWSITDNGNNTLTVRFRDYSWTTPGRFPDGPFEVVFKDHNYTPNKDNNPIGYTWHWDNISVR